VDPETLQQLGLEKLEAYQGVAVCASAVMGLLSCFFGYKLFKLMLALTGLAVGSFMAAAVAQHLTGGQTWMILAAAVAGGVVGAAAFYVLHVLFVFLLGAGAGAGLTVAGFAVAGHAPHYVAVVLGATVGGVVALLLRKPVIIVLTALSGAWAVASGALYFLGYGLTEEQITLLQQDPNALAQVVQELPRAPYLVALGSALVLAIAGMLVQWGGEKPKPAAEEEKAEE
jgi:hypothetical protein